MKKMLIMLVTVCTMLFSSVCSAADGADLDKAQVNAEKLMGSFATGKIVYEDVVSGFNVELKNKITGQVYTELQKQVKNKFGTVKESKFYAFQRFDQNDRLTYSGSCSKVNLVAFVFSCDKRGKIVDFSITPIQQNESEK